jgi:hypothetical protein
MAHFHTLTRQEQAGVWCGNYSGTGIIGFPGTTRAWRTRRYKSARSISIIEGSQNEHR